MKVLFLDIDGVVNSIHTKEIFDGCPGIEYKLAYLVNKIVRQTDCKVVLSSTWRLDAARRGEVVAKVCDFIDTTPVLGDVLRGLEIKFWLDQHPEVKTYAILDDLSDFLIDQLPNLFQTPEETGLTQDIANKVIEHLNR